MTVNAVYKSDFLKKMYIFLVAATNLSIISIF